MGRSVSTLHGARLSSYISVDDEANHEWMVEDLQEVGQELKLTSCQRWDGREVQIIMSGHGVEVGISEYCGIVSIGIRTEEESDPIGDKWIDKNGQEIIKAFHHHGTPIRSVGTFSNGETIYEKK
jgi:hypothetical protein